MSYFIEKLWFYIIAKRATSAKIAENRCFKIIDLLDVKPPKTAAITTQITKNT